MSRKTSAMLGFAGTLDFLACDDGDRRGGFSIHAFDVAAGDFDFFHLLRWRRLGDRTVGNGNQARRSEAANETEWVMRLGPGGQVVAGLAAGIKGTKTKVNIRQAFRPKRPKRLACAGVSYGI